MTVSGSERPRRGRLLLASALLVAGCAHSRQVYYPHRAGRVASARPRRTARAPAPRVEVRVEGQTRSLPPMLED